MKTKIQKRIMKKRKGFTLIEMVIVITIIGILSSIAVTKYSKIQEILFSQRCNFVDIIGFYDKLYEL